MNLNILQLILALLQLAPVIAQGIVTVEGAVGRGNGPAKKAILMTAVDSATPPEIKAKIGELIDQQATLLKPVLDAMHPTPAAVQNLHPAGSA